MLPCEPWTEYHGLVLMELVAGMITQWVISVFLWSVRQVFIAFFSASLVIKVGSLSCSFPPTYFLILTYSRRRQFWVLLSTYNIDPSQWFPAWGIFLHIRYFESPSTCDVCAFSICWQRKCVMMREGKKYLLTVQLLSKGWGSHRTFVKVVRFEWHLFRLKKAGVLKQLILIY